MFILKSEQVTYCTLGKQTADALIKMPGLEYQRKLYIKGDIFYRQDRQKAMQRARQMLLDTKGQETILVDETDMLSLWHRDKGLQKVDTPYVVNLSGLVAAMRNVGGVSIKARAFRLKTYPQCFVGSEAVDWLVSYLDISRRQAVHIGQRLVDEGWIHHVVDEQPFADAYFFYRFRWDEQ